MNESKNKREPLRVAIVGASGIGKNHAVWFAKNGAEVCAFVGSSPATLPATSEILQSKLGYTPRGYSELGQLLASEKLDVVCISSPPQLHFEQAMLCLEKGIPTLCEKPLVYDAGLSHEKLKTQARELVTAANERDVLLGTQLQYSFLAEKLCEMAGLTASSIERYTMEIETKNIKPGRSHETIWIELAPHPLSVLQKLLPEGELVANSIQCRVQERETVADFRLRRADGSEVEARITARHTPEATMPLRRFTLNSAVLDCASRKNDNGDFVTFLSSAGKEIEMPDLVDLLIGNFLRAVRGEEALLATGEDGARNVEWMLGILGRGERG